MDAFTLIVASGLAAGIMAATMFLLYRAGSRAAGLVDWSLAGLLFFASNAVAFAASVTQVYDVSIAAIGNALYVAGHFGVLAGLRRHLGLNPRYVLLLALVLAAVLVHRTGFAQASVANRLLLFAPAIVAINGAVVWHAWHVPLMVLELLFMMQMVVRTGYIAVHRGTTLTFMGSQSLQTLGSLSVFVFLMVAGMSCALIVIRHQELALRKASLTDNLTGWLNRRALHDVAERECLRARRSGGRLSFLAFDIDHFKSINDRHGHAVGDSAICHVTALAAQALRGYDGLFRLGGEEFAILLTGSGDDTLLRIAERVRDSIARTPLYAEDKAVAMTVSIGLASCAPGDTGWEDALRRADLALYRSKREGRNRVTLDGDTFCTAAAA
ncbi:GGDEF domain-containing protein [Pseudoduganella chitinolytica]|uniref:diguanylate cyclase n=1 Tax=Pseudoduganella chitinolytica TaxID=34070 RepID=A0ABY8B9U3_9BURK|nr:GGDEF domain-containing protein [Pseudoduganella chitinolytica]WEF32701.1 GGDEF domain-containing protein [Pseudoduganella chitinolytica]